MVNLLDSTPNIQFFKFFILNRASVDFIGPTCLDFKEMFIFKD